MHCDLFSPCPLPSSVNKTFGKLCFSSMPTLSVGIHTIPSPCLHQTTISQFQNLYAIVEGTQPCKYYLLNWFNWMKCNRLWPTSDVFPLPHQYYIFPIWGTPDVSSWVCYLILMCFVHLSTTRLSALKSEPMLSPISGVLFILNPISPKRDWIHLICLVVSDRAIY